MLENKISPTNKEETSKYLEITLKDLGWNNVKEIVKANRKFKSKFLQGGHQFKAKNFTRAIQIIVDQSNEYDNHIIFFRWCAHIRHYDDILENIFKDNDESEDSETKYYEINEELFDSFLDILKNNHFGIFIYISPIKFTEEQKDEFLKKEKELKINSDKKNSIKLKNKADRKIKAAKEEIRNLKANIRSLKKDIKTGENENNLLNNQLNTITQELEKSQQTASKYEEKLLAIEEKHLEKVTELKNIIETEKAKSQNYINKNQDKLNDNAERIDSLTDELTKRTEQIENIEKQLAHYKDKFFKKVTSLFEQINTVEIIGALNEPDEVKDLLLSVVRVPEDDHSLSKNISDIFFRKSWFHMVRQELNTIKKVSTIDVNELIDSKFSQKWPDYTDLLVDLKYSLKARATILNLILETMRQFFKEEDYHSSKSKFLKKPQIKTNKQKLNILDLPQKTIHRLNSAGIRTVDELIKNSEYDLLKIKIGRKMLKKIKYALHKRNLKLS